ncbi:aspartyl/asparaginyl beta-hydroxylase isoform X2 [Sorex araneus]|uniref:aspartyl/asparaginyl beta-hydroxylase isoform X2 n=1 Tax=Sorex araneus TaxID=42254 RepID=UPI00243405D4|nr:aspartyl/asparaginyl beta-hydroxylase isoform X2 [Sorex araneus]
MAPRKNAKGGGGNSSSGSGSGSQGSGSSGSSSGGGGSGSSSSSGGSSSGGSSSSSGSRRETKHGGHKNGRKGGISGSSFFTWFMVIALLGVWTSVAVVWFELVDYEEVLAKAKDFRYNLSEVLQGKLGIYDADGDGDFDVEDAKVLLGLKERSASEPRELPDEVENYPWLEEPVPESRESQNIEVFDKEDEVQEQIQHHLHQSAPTEHVSAQESELEKVCDRAGGSGTGEPRDVLLQEDDELAREQEPEDNFLRASPAEDNFEPPDTAPFYEAEISYQVEDDTAIPVYNQDMDEAMYEQENPDASERLGTEDERILHDAEIPLPPEEQELPPATNRKTDDPEQKEKVKKKKPKLLNKFDKTIKAELDAAEKLRKRGKVEEAMQAFEELVRKYPQSPRARYGKAQCEDDLAEKRRSNEILRGAIETYQEVASLPDAPADLVKLSLKRRSERQQFLGHMRGSLLTLQRLVQLFPDETSLKNDLGVGYLLLGDNDSAKKVYEEVLNVRPNDGFAKVHYGFILKAQNKIAESIPYLKEGIESGDPGTDDGRFYFHLGDAMQRVGNKEAYKWYELGHKRGHFASVWQRSLYNVQGLKAQPWWTAKETGYTELVKSLERNWKLIRDEGLAVMDQAKGLFLPEDENLREKGDWSQFTLWQQGRKNENSCKGAPKTCSLLDKFSETTGCRRGQIKYSVMHPGTHVWPHTGPTNCRLRMHLGLVIPKEGCKIRCANETRTWEEGKVLIFDDSFEHEVWQDATSFRLIFIVDVWHPELTAQQRRNLPAI